MAELTPMDATIYGMARQAARAVVMGYLTPAQRDAALIAAACRAEREGRTESTAPRVVRFAQHLAKQEAQHVDIRRRSTEYRIAREARRLIEANAPVGRVWAEVHNINGAAGFPLTEEEVRHEVTAEAAAVIRARHWQARQGLRRAG